MSEAEQMLLSDALEVAIESAHQAVMYKNLVRLLVVANVVQFVAIILIMTIGG